MIYVLFAQIVYILTIIMKFVRDKLQITGATHFMQPSSLLQGPMDTLVPTEAQNLSNPLTKRNYRATLSTHASSDKEAILRAKKNINEVAKLPTRTLQARTHQCQQKHDTLTQHNTTQQITMDSLDLRREPNFSNSPARGRTNAPGPTGAQSPPEITLLLQQIAAQQDYTYNDIYEILLA